MDKDQFETFIEIESTRIRLIHTYDQKEAYAAYSAGAKVVDYFLNSSPRIKSKVTVEKAVFKRDTISSYP